LWSIFTEIKNCTCEDDRTMLGKRMSQKYNVFFSDCLKHMNEEEQERLPWIWERFTDEEVLDMDIRSLKAFPTEAKLKQLPMLFSVLNLDERASFLQHVKHCTEPDLFEKICGAIKSVIGELDWKELQQHCTKKKICI